MIAQFAASRSVQKVVYTSTNCLWGEPLGRPVREDDDPRPVEIYGRSKLEGEKGDGRLGLSILFEFIQEGRRSGWSATETTDINSSPPRT
jgi:UDP-glucose 4-epimerase